ncbi:MAG: hypothetical protein ABJB66_15185 [Gemmatimonadaceae bacterium]
MAKAIPVKQAARFWLFTVIAAVVLYYGYTISDYLIFNPTSSTAMKWLGVAMAPIAILPWLFVLVVSLSVVDEYYRRVVMVGTSVAFVLDIMFHMAFGAAVQAHVVSQSYYILELGAGIVSWLIGVSLCLAYYRLRQ